MSVAEFAKLEQLKGGRKSSAQQVDYRAKSDILRTAVRATRSSTMTTRTQRLQSDHSLLHFRPNWPSPCIGGAMLSCLFLLSFSLFRTSAPSAVCPCCLSLHFRPAVVELAN